jgi:hypothetical protein
MNANRRLLLVIFLALLVMYAVPLWAQTAAGGAAPAPVVSTDLEKSISIAGIASAVLQFLKKTSWFPVLSEKSSRRFKIVAGAVVAAATTLGISYSHPSANSLLITWPGWSALASHAFEFGRQWLFQEAWYRKLIANGGNGAAAPAPAGK